MNIVIIGGGPGGATLASYLSLAGIPCTIYEAATHPRPHVGESLVPVTTRVFEEIGFLPVMEKERFVHKYGASWHPPFRRREISIDFKEFPQEGINQDYTYHVNRSIFDHRLFEHASRLGANVYQNAEVKKVLTDNDRVCGVKVVVDGREQTVETNLVVDASGRRALLGRQLGMLEKDPQFDQFAIHAWFTDVDRSPNDRSDDIHIYFLPVERGWIWQIPITDEITSVGVVVDRKLFKTMKGGDEAWFQAMIEGSPDASEAMRNAHRVNEFKREADYSYSMKRFSGPGFLMIGDAARFVDPIFSSGVSVAMYSAKFAADAICAIMHKNASPKEALEYYETRLRRGCNIWYEFILLYYRLLPLFTLFIQDQRYRQQILRLLQGDVYDRTDVPVLDEMRRFIASVEANSSHLMNAYLGKVDLDAVDALFKE